MNHTPNGTGRSTESVVHMTDQEDGEQRIETRGNGNQQAEDDHQEDEFTDQEESDDEEDDEQDEDEPSLKYQRISGEIPELLKKDSASALAISNKSMVLSCFFFRAGHDVHSVSL